MFLRRKIRRKDGKEHRGKPLREQWSHGAANVLYLGEMA